MNPLRRAWLQRLALLGGACWAPVAAVRAQSDSGVRRGRLLDFPRDHGAHPGTRTEWWYATGWLGTRAMPTHGFQITFFRSRTGLADDNPSRFAARQLLFAHAAWTDIAVQRHLHDQRIARWNGDPTALPAHAGIDDAMLRIGDWSMAHRDKAWQVQAPAAGFELALTLSRSQPLLLQGDRGYSRKGPDELQASHYVSEPQLVVGGTVRLAGAAAGTPGAVVAAGEGRAWLDHEWSDQLLHPEAVGWDWIGINLFDGSALTAFVLRKRDGSAIWAGGSFRKADEPTAISFGPEAVQMLPRDRWRSPASGADYPIRWQVQTPAGRFDLRALAHSQEIDSRASTGTIYWEGLSELLDSNGRRIGLGYLEMTGYAGTLRL